MLPEIQRDNSDWPGCLSVFLPTVITEMGIRECQSEAVKVIQTCLKLGPETSYVVKQIADTGVSSGWPSVASSVIKLVPQFISEAMKDTNHGPVIEALFHRLNDQNVGPGALNALKRYKEIPLHIGDRTFEYYVRKIPDKHRKQFDLMSNNTDHHGGRKKKKSEANVYGTVPQKLIQKLCDKSNSNSQVEASESIRIELESTFNISALEPHLTEFMALIAEFLENTNFWVVNNMLEILLILQKRLPNQLCGQVKEVVQMLSLVNSEMSTDTKVLVNENFMKLMYICGPQDVVNELLDKMSNKNARVKEDILNTINAMMLTFPSSDLDIDHICIATAEFLMDPKRRVRQAALESVALSAACLGNKRIQLLYDFVAHLERKERAFGLLAAVKTRISRKSLPKLNSQGLVEYGLSIPAQLEADYNRKQQQRGEAEIQEHSEDPDTAWILQGVGPLTRGVAGAGGNSGDSRLRTSLSFPRYEVR